MKHRELTFHGEIILGIFAVGFLLLTFGCIGAAEHMIGWSISDALAFVFIGCFAFTIWLAGGFRGRD